MQKIFLLSPLFAVCRASTGGIVNANDLWGRGPSQLGARQSAATTNATRKPYRLVDEYDAANFWDKFNFIETTDDSPDPTFGFVKYQTRAEAERMGLISSEGGVAMMRVDTETVYSGRNLSGLGRASVRVESVASYGEGLIVGDFTHLPPPQCGIWPAFWTFSQEAPGWPYGGEIDIYEQWNEYQFNRQSLHMNDTWSGGCNLSTIADPHDPIYTNYIYANNCTVVLPDNTGCSTWDYEGPYGRDGGGVYAMELSKTSLKLWTFHHPDVPADLAGAVANSSASARPDPETWGRPGLMTSSLDESCDVAATFKNQTIILNLELCGSAADGTDWANSCALKTGYNQCARYVAENPQDFKDYWFGIRSLRVYQQI